MEEHNRKKEEREKRDIAELKVARENAKRKLAALTDKLGNHINSIISSCFG